MQDSERSRRTGRSRERSSRQRSDRRSNSRKSGGAVAESDQGYVDEMGRGSEQNSAQGRSSNFEQLVEERKPRSKKARSKKSEAGDPLEPAPKEMQSTHNSANMAEADDGGIDFEQEEDKNTGESDVQRQIDARNSHDPFAIEHLPDLDCEPPIPLITISSDKNGKDVFKTNSAALDELSKIDTPLAVFSVCGQQGLGKSYLLNCVLDLIGEDKRESGFRVARSLSNRLGKQKQEQGGTTGVWMLGMPIYVESRDLHIVVLDFQGFRSSKHDNKSMKTSVRSEVANQMSTDSKLFALCTLLSSTICFNLRKNFEEKTLEDFDMIRDLSRLIKVKPSNQASSLMKAGGTPGGRGPLEDQAYQDHLFPQLMPRLMWLVRDHKIQFKDKQGNDITENQYLENKLSQIAKSNSRAIARTRDKIIKSFPDRELVAMTNPMGADVEDDPGDLASLDPEHLGQEFVDGCRYLRLKLLNDTPVKQIWSRKITGPTFVFLLKEYITALNVKGSVIHFSNVWEFFLGDELNRIYEESLVQVEKTIRNHMWGQEDEGQTPGDVDSEVEIHYEKLPLCRQDVMFIFDNLRTEVISRFDNLLKLANTRAERDEIGRKMEQLEKEIVVRLRPFDQKNKAESQKHLSELDERLFRDIRKGVSQRKEQLKIFALGKQLEEYLETMEDDSEWKRVSDSENVHFLLSKLPENLDFVHEQLEKTLLMAEDQNQVVNDAIAAKEAVEAQIAAEKEKRKEHRQKLEKLRDEEYEVYMLLDQHEKEIEALEPKIEGIENEISSKQSDLMTAQREYHDGNQFRTMKRELEQELKRAQLGLLNQSEDMRGTSKSGKSSKSAAGKSAFGFLANMMGNNQQQQLESETNLDPNKQKVPKVTRNLPHVRQPERRDRDFKGNCQSFVERQYLPKFFNYI